MNVNIDLLWRIWFAGVVVVGLWSLRATQKDPEGFSIPMKLWALLVLVWPISFSVMLGAKGWNAIRGMFKKA